MILTEPKLKTHPVVYGYWESDKIADDGKSFRPYKRIPICTGPMVPGIIPGSWVCKNPGCCFVEIGSQHETHV